EYPFMPRAEMDALRAEAQAENGASFMISGSDIDPQALALCEKHIRQAGFEGRIPTSCADLRSLNVPGEPGVFLLNPPYGERLSDQRHARELYRELGMLLKRHPGWKMGVITSDAAFERSFGRRADRKRRLYNGRLECDFFIFL
ncbi:MAG: class I SAM-dependent RNA methyltransferase, partial [Clostridia bacterium]